MRAPVSILHTLILLSAVLALPAWAETVDQVARQVRPGQRVYDLAGVLAPEEASALNLRLQQMEWRGLAEGAVFVIRTLGGYDVHDFAKEVGQKLRVGSRETHNGFVLVLSMGDRKWHLATGVGLEVLLPDSTIVALGRRELVPRLRSGQTGAALLAMVGAVEQSLQRAGGAQALPSGGSREVAFPLGGVLLTLLLSAATIATAVLAYPRGTPLGKDPWRIPAIVLGMAAVTIGIATASGAGAEHESLAWIGVAPAIFATVRLAEGVWAPLALESAAATLRRIRLLYWVGVAIAVLVGLIAAPGIWLVLTLLVAVPLGLALPAYVARLPRRCPHCRGILTWLPEAEEGSVLQPEESREQSLRSVEYDVWKCAGCDRKAVFGRDLGRHYSRCPRCGRRTLRRGQEVENAEGCLWVTEVSRCLNQECGYLDRRRVSHTPQRQGGDWHGPGGIVFLPGVFGGSGSDSGGHDSGGWGGWGGDSGGGIDVGGFGGSGDFGGGGGGGDW